MNDDIDIFIYLETKRRKVDGVGLRVYKKYPLGESLGGVLIWSKK